MDLKPLRKFFNDLPDRIGLRGLLLVLPTYAWFIITLIIPISFILVLSFAKLDAVTREIIEFPVIDNYAVLISNFDYLKVLFRTVSLAIGVTISSVGIAYLIAYFITFRISKYKYFVIFLLQTPFFASFMLILLAWRLILGKTGLINSFIMFLGLTNTPIGLFGYNLSSVWLVLTNTWFPWLILPIFVSLEKIDRSLLEASQDLGASSFQTFIKVTFPLSLPGVFVAILFVLVPTLGEFVAPRVIGGTSGFMFGNLIEDFFLGGFRWSVGSAFTVYLLGIALLAAYLLYRRIGFRRLMEGL
jgi:spermidine/putrescine transport system permease protein